ncbi:sigma-54 dependent transcriptional regulator [Sorangium sp. So ce315]|uniref:sigma-54-dependent transcriptional regulator n=1 Tax=Sorangium sp. So ce315 TaxID=3133299 RepID=UPI003F62F994
MKKPHVLIVDDERVFTVLAEDALSAEGFEARTAPSLARAKAEIERAVPDVVILDRRLPDGDGITLLRALRAEGSAAPLVVMVTAYGDIANAVEALQAGAVDYLAKPVQPTDLVLKLRKALEVRGLHDRLALARGGRATRIEPKSAAMRAAFDVLRRVSESPLTPVLLVGPSGAGKQYAAEALHAMTHPPSGAAAAFVDVNCAALPANLVESELFGHERGAFTDARSARRGLIEMADGGTLFLDEITELPEPSQAKLLKFLDTMRFRRLGGQREIEVALRVVAATNHDIVKLVRSGRFREDLYHRIAVFQIQLPALAARTEDIHDLARAFVQRCAARVKKRTPALSSGALAALLAYDYPGNVRELRNIIERAVILARGAEITEREIILPDRPDRAEDAPAFFSIKLCSDGAPPKAIAVERAYVVRVLEHLQGRRMAAAQALGLSYPTFLKRLRELGIDGE